MRVTMSWLVIIIAIIPFFSFSVPMTGRVVIDIIIVEGNQTWQPLEISTAISQVRDGLVWWEGLAPGEDLSFIIDDPDLVSTPYDPGSYREYIWLLSVMQQLGYDQPEYVSAVFQHNAMLKEFYGTEKAFTIFVIKGSRFQGLLGAGLCNLLAIVPNAPASYGASGLKIIVAHEVGHIFCATQDNRGIMRSCCLIPAFSNREVSLLTRLQIGWISFIRFSYLPIVVGYLRWHSLIQP